MKNNDGNTHSQMARVVERNINALLKRRKEENDRKTTEEHLADHVTRFAGSMLLFTCIL